MEAAAHTLCVHTCVWSYTLRIVSLSYKCTYTYFIYLYFSFVFLFVVTSLLKRLTSIHYAYSLYTTH